MNQRIQELAKEHLRHEMYAAYGEIVEGDYYEFDPKELQNFVESIVRECSEIAAQYAEPVWAIELVNDIKEHFGVRE